MVMKFIQTLASFKILFLFYRSQSSEHCVAEISRNLIMPCREYFTAKCSIIVGTVPVQAICMPKRRAKPCPLTLKIIPNKRFCLQKEIYRAPLFTFSRELFSIGLIRLCFLLNIKFCVKLLPERDFFFEYHK